MLTDAKQRLVLTKPRAMPDSDNGKNIVCAEPSPDVAQAVSSTIDLAFKKVGSADKSLGINAAFNLSEAVVQLGERLAVIQLFRDRMYRACEAYANGAIDEVAYTLMLARNDKTVTTLLSQEMAAGAFGRPPAKLGGSASSVDPKRRAELESEITKLAKELEDIAATPDGEIENTFGKEENRGKLASEAASKLNEKHTELLILELSTVRSTASSVIQRKGMLTSGMENIHRAYLDDPGLEPLFDACLTAVTTIKLTNTQAKEVAKAEIERAESIK